MVFPFNSDVFDPNLPLKPLDPGELAKFYSLLTDLGDQERTHSFVVNVNRYGMNRRRLDDAMRKATSAARKLSGAFRCMLEHMTDEEIAELRSA